MTTNKEPFEKALAATPELPANAALGAYRKIRRRIVLKNIAGFSGAFGTIAVLVFISGISWLRPTPPAHSAEVAEELQYVHDCLWGTDLETSAQYASVLE